MDRFWLLTSTTYGTWLPGDGRGSVTRVREDAGPRLEHDRPQTPYIEAAPGLRQSAEFQLKGPPIFFTPEQAELVAAQFRETADYRGWTIIAGAIMANHFHVLTGVPGDPEPSDLLRDFNSYASRRLNQQWGKPESETWWTAKGSMRKKGDWEAIRNSVDYLKGQINPLVLWVDDDAVEIARNILLNQASGGR